MGRRRASHGPSSRLLERFDAYYPPPEIAAGGLDHLGRHLPPLTVLDSRAGELSAQIPAHLLRIDTVRRSELRWSHAATLVEVPVDVKGFVVTVERG